MGVRLVHTFKTDLSTGEAARHCGVSPQTIINWCEMGRLKSSRIDSGPRRIPKSEIRELLLRNNLPIPQDLREPAEGV